VREVSDSFLLQMAEISAGLFGLLLVGMLFFVETGFRRLGAEREAVVHYFRASTRIVLVPWVLGGVGPSREDLTWAILIAFGTAFLSLATLLLSVFDIAVSER
jgi:hypothetical protein